MKKFYIYAAFALCILLTSITVIPVLMVRPFNPTNVQSFLNILRFFANLLIPIRFKAVCEENFNQEEPSIVIANHQSNLDMLWACYTLPKNIIALGKKEIMFIPFFGLGFWLAGNIFIKRGSKNSRNNAIEKMKNNIQKKNLSIVIFPEGHRNQKEELLKFKLGAFLLAKELEIPIQIMCIEPYHKLKKNQYEVQFLKEISKKDVVNFSAEDLALNAKARLQAALNLY